ncbi:MAG: hypothetical protein R3F07_17440 [Opitutaceae bacterium]
MKVGFLSESPADEAAICILVEAVLGRPIRRVHPPLRARGWPNVKQILPAVLRHLQFRTDARGLVVVVDSDDSPIHDDDHEDPSRFSPECRLCQLEQVIRQTTRRWHLPRGMKPLLVATGLAVPAVEGWYLCGRDREVGEADWRAHLGTGNEPYTRRDLKHRTYGTTRPSLRRETDQAVEDAKRLAHEIGRLEADFPVGFGNLAREVGLWRAMVDG